MEQYIENEPPPFESITENVYLDDAGNIREKKKAKKMVCECQFDPGTSMLRKHSDLCNNTCLCQCCMCARINGNQRVHFRFIIEMDDPETACGEDCLNRLLLIEWYDY